MFDEEIELRVLCFVMSKKVCFISKSSTNMIRFSIDFSIIFSFSTARGYLIETNLSFTSTRRAMYGVSDAFGLIKEVTSGVANRRDVD